MEKKIRIAQVAPLFESVPPKLYGGTERVVHNLTEQLCELGHHVTLFASGDSESSANLLACSPKGLRLSKELTDHQSPHIIQLDILKKMEHNFDIMHFHTSPMHFPFADFFTCPTLTTLHGRLDFPEFIQFYNYFDKVNLNSISYSQRSPIPHNNWVGNVYHGLSMHNLKFEEHPENYVAFLGRISPEKRVDRAIEIAIANNIPIKIAAKIDKVDEKYFRTQIAHLFNHPLVEYIGEINEPQKQDFLGKARALLFPIDWPEPFGMVMIESMACGVPVLAFNHGSVCEVIDDGKSGIIVNSMGEAIEKMNSVLELDRSQVRKIFEEKYTAKRMALDYIKIYDQLIRDKSLSDQALPSQFEIAS